MIEHDFLEAARLKDEENRKAFLALKDKVLADGELDEDGYPTSSTLYLISIWHSSEPIKEWFEFIETIWHLRSWGWYSGFNSDGNTVYHVSTAGWSGNESIIEAMQKNYIFWNETWVQSRRGGHYIFEVEV